MKVSVALASLAALSSLAVTPAQAHLGHLADRGQGHAHWLALAIFIGIAAYGAARLLRRRAERQLEKTENQ